MKKILEKLNTRHKQAYAGLCLSSYCKSVGIKHEAIDELITHQISLLSASNIPEWDAKGCNLYLVGRGEPIPEDLKAQISKNDLEAFSFLVEYSVEVGIVDLYGVPTDMPEKFLKKCIEILNNKGIELPDLDNFAELCFIENEWGAPLNDSITKMVLEL